LFPIQAEDFSVSAILLNTRITADIWNHAFKDQ